jgi:hypothetical protein
MKSRVSDRGLRLGVCLPPPLVRPAQTRGVRGPTPAKSRSGKCALACCGCRHTSLVAAACGFLQRSILLKQSARSLTASACLRDRRRFPASCRNVRSKSTTFREQCDDSVATCRKKCVKSPVAATSDCSEMPCAVDSRFRGVAADGPKSRSHSVIPK